MEAFAHVRQAPDTLLALLVVLMLSTFSFNFNVLLPVLAGATLESGANVFGVITAMFGLGALVGALMAASLGRASWPVMLVAAGGFGLAQMVLAPIHSASAAGVCC